MTKPVITASNLLGFRLMVSGATVTADHDPAAAISAKLGEKLGLKEGGKTVLGSIGADVLVAPGK
jgi:hypothetical protein